jgi:hypothetical protein
MKFLFATIILFLAFQSCNRSQNQNEPDDAKIILDLEEKWGDALVKDDSAAMATFPSPLSVFFTDKETVDSGLDG